MVLCFKSNKLYYYFIWYHLLDLTYKSNKLYYISFGTISKELLSEEFPTSSLIIVFGFSEDVLPILILSNISGE